ncbi:hypothetical protein LDENG_00001170 [Lucifuga dentata]|nr:hypothetical protein LDENG_00001170 [Lucifuga dentata]
MVPGCTMGRKQASGGSEMIWVMFCWETLGPAVDVDVPLTCTTYLNIAADQVQPSWQQYSLMAVVSFSRIMPPATLQKWFRNCLRNMTKSSS